MKALETHVLARFFIDDPEDAQAARQRPAAVAALSERCFVSVTVLLELVGVLRGFYELPAKDISRVLRTLAGIRHVTLEDRDAVLSAIDAFDKGLDFADALRGARSTRAAAFATFDRRLAKKAQGLALSLLRRTAGLRAGRLRTSRANRFGVFLGARIEQSRAG